MQAKGRSSGAGQNWQAFLYLACMISGARLPCSAFAMAWTFYSLQKLMGHADLQVLQRYWAQTTDDIYRSHAINSPVDNTQFKNIL
jgi:hypothetical protein